MPDWKREICKQLASLNLAPTREAEIVEELSQHAEDLYRELKSGGASEPEARRLALAEITAHESLARELRAVERSAPEPIVPGFPNQGNFFFGSLQDLRFAFRTLSKSPGFTAIAVLMLALGIGANTAIFSVVNGVLLRPLDYPDPERLVDVFESSREFPEMSVAYPNYLDWRRENHSFVDISIHRADDFNFTGAGDPEQLSGAYISASLLPVLGVKPLLGRYFLPEEDLPGAPCATILTYGLWQQRFAGDPAILRKSLTLNAKSCAVVGVMPNGFQIREASRLYVPIQQWSQVELHSREDHPGLQVFGRLRPGVSVREAQTEMAAICGRLARQYPATNASRSAEVVGMKEKAVQDIRPTLLLLMGAVGLVLLIACANIANLLLARSTARKREFAIRVALGAQRWRIVRQLLMESALLSLGAGVFGLLLARWATSLIVAAAPASLPRSGAVGVDLFVLLFTLAVSLATGISFGTIPAIHSASADPQEALKQGTRGAGGGRHRAEGAFVSVEVGLAVVLLAGAALMIQSIWRLLQVNPGFNTENVLTMQVALSPRVMASAPGIRSAYQQVLERVRSVPAVKSAALTALVPLSDDDNEIPFWPGTGPQPPQDRLDAALCYFVTPDYSAVMQIPLLRGRFLTERDNLQSSPVIVIDEVLAQHWFPDQNPLGKRISLVIFGPVEIVGVVGHVKQFGLDADDTSKIRDQLYFPVLQVSDKFMIDGAVGVTLALRTVSEPSSVIAAVRSQVAGPTRDQPVYAVRTMGEIVSRSLAERRFTMLVLVIFAGAALLLAAVGIYSVMSYAVTRRFHELGIRAALGASRDQMVALVLREGMRLAGIGMIAGLIAALALTRLLAKLLYGVRPADPLTFAGVSLLLGSIALLACYLPARRATSVDPIAVLRSE